MQLCFQTFTSLVIYRKESRFVWDTEHGKRPVLWLESSPFPISFPTWCHSSPSPNIASSSMLLKFSDTVIWEKEGKDWGEVKITL